MEIKIIYLPRAQADLSYWKKSGNKIIQQRISKLIQSISKTPFEGIGKPEPLKHDYTGWWSRRINEKHRFGIPGGRWENYDCTNSVSLLG